MINPLDYLYYKVYTFLLHISSGRAPLNRSAAYSILLFANACTIYILITGKFSRLFVFAGLLIGLFVFIRYRPKNEEIIVEKYRKESNKSRIRGNIIVTIYVLLTFAALICTILYHSPASK